MRNLRLPSPDEQGDLLALWAFIFGSWVRLFPAAIAGFPINDGGLFYQMILEIQKNGFRLPALVHYNGLDIPFVYPPLGFYLAAILGKSFHLSPLSLLQWLPAIFSIGTLFAFHRFSRAVLESRFQAGLASLIFAFTPRSITWLTMGGGLTRSLGQLFLILTILSVYRLFSFGRRYLGASVLFGSLTVLTHPEATVHAVGIALLLWALKGRTKDSLLSGLATGAGVIALTSIWWLAILSRHGFSPLASALQTGSPFDHPLLFALLMTFSEEPLMSLVMVLAFIGLAVRVAKGDYLLPLLLALPFFVEPRGAPTVATIPMALLASSALAELILPALAELEARARKIDPSNLLNSRTVQGILIFTALYLMGSMFLFGTQIAGTRVSPENRAAFNWARENTDASSRFLVLTGEAAPFCDGVQEWFPALAQRVSIGTIQGREWLDGPAFVPNMAMRMQLQNCNSDASPAACAEQQARDLGTAYDYVYALRSSEFKPNCAAIGLSRSQERVIADFERSGDYMEVYASPEVVIFARETRAGSDNGE